MRDILSHKVRAGGGGRAEVRPIRRAPTAPESRLIRCCMMKRRAFTRECLRRGGAAPGRRGRGLRRIAGLSRGPARADRGRAELLVAKAVELRPESTSPTPSGKTSVGRWGAPSLDGATAPGASRPDRPPNYRQNPDQAASRAVHDAPLSWPGGRPSLAQATAARPPLRLRRADGVWQRMGQSRETFKVLVAGVVEGAHRGAKGW